MAPRTTPARASAPAPKAHCVLVLQGGGALGAYQAGVYEGLSQHGVEPEWFAGISIGAINAALMVGNPPGRRTQRLHAFWDRISVWSSTSLPALHGAAHQLQRELHAAAAVVWGLPGFFTPRFPPAPMQWPGTPQALSYYDTEPLKATLEELVDFDLVNAGGTRLSVGAVNVRTGNFRYFDSAQERLGVEHILASAALPPGFAPVQIGGEFYWDGGIVSNTPLQHVLEQAASDLLVFQVDLFSAIGALPRTLLDVVEREKDIRFSSRTRYNTDTLRRLHTLRCAAHELLAKLPPALRASRAAQTLAQVEAAHDVTIVHLINRRGRCDSSSKDYEFSHQTMREHWQAGREDLDRTLASAAWRQRSHPHDGVLVIDAARPRSSSRKSPLT